MKPRQFYCSLSPEKRKIVESLETAAPTDKLWTVTDDIFFCGLIVTDGQPVEWAGYQQPPPPPSLYPLPPPPLPTPVNGRSQSVAAALISTGQRQECIHRPKLTTESDSFKDLENLSSSQQVLPFVYSTVRIKLINMNKTGA